MTKSIYEKEPMFRDFARNIPLSQSIDDSTSLHSLKRDFQSWCLQRTPHLEDLTLSSHLQDKTDFTSRRAKCCLNVTKAKLRLPSSFPISTSITGTLPEALKGKQVAKVGKDCDLPLILKLSKIPFAILQGGEIFVCHIGLRIHIMKLEINMPLKQKD